jgi:hypothetical protein
MIIVDILSLNRSSLLFTVHHISKKKYQNVWIVFKTCLYLLCNQMTDTMNHKILPPPIEVKMFLLLIVAAFVSVLIQIIIK